MTISAVSLTVQALLANAGVTALVSTRIYPAPLPQGTTLPAITVYLASEHEDRLLGGMSGYPIARVMIGCHSATATASLAIGEAVKTALANLLYTTGGKNADFQKNGPDFTDWDEQGQGHRRLIGFDVRWR